MPHACCLLASSHVPAILPCIMMMMMGPAALLQQAHSVTAHGAEDNKKNQGTYSKTLQSLH
jgi:hypothetical protein